jgi:predicted nucleic acid-binding protein
MPLGLDLILTCTIVHIEYAAIPIRLVDPPLQQAARLSQQLNIYAYDAYVIACAINQRAPILSLDNVLKERARSLKLEILEVKTA